MDESALHFYCELNNIFQALSKNNTGCMLQRLFVVPTTAEQSKIPYARVNHAKFMVTDNVAYIGILRT